MILHALKEYYDRKAADPESGIAPEGWEKKEFFFIAEISLDGKFKQFHDMRELKDKKVSGRFFLVPSLGEKKGNGIKANLLWENIEYLLGIPVPTAAKKNPDVDRVKMQFEAFKQRLLDLSGDLPLINALHLYALNKNPIVEAESDPLWIDVKKENRVIILAVNGEVPVTEDQNIREIINKTKAQKNDTSFCFVSGNDDEIARLEPPIKGVIDFYQDRKGERSIISFNRDAFESYGKLQNFNCPIGKRAYSGYTTALNVLLSKESKQKILIGDSTYVFWSQKRTNLESDFSFLFAPPFDNPDEGTRAVKALYKSIVNGAYVEPDGDVPFFLLGLTPRGPRLAIREWRVGTVAEFSENIHQHFTDLEIEKPEYEPLFYPIKALIKYCAPLDDAEKFPPNLAGDFMQSVLTGATYPATLLQAALRRIHSDTENRVKPVRAALIKAYLNRYYRFYPNQNHKEVEMGLDVNQPSIGYQLGRLFATLEKIQEKANPGINATIRERYYGSACASPVTVFANLMRLKNHHLAKMDKGSVVYFERLLGEIVGRLPKGSDGMYAFPAHLDLHEQGRFAIGYYHQRQDFFTRKTDNDNDSKQ